jgi:hypothetical protein
MGKAQFPQNRAVVGTLSPQRGQVMKSLKSIKAFTLPDGPQATRNIQADYDLEGEAAYLSSGVIV